MTVLENNTRLQQDGDVRRAQDSGALQQQDGDIRRVQDSVTLQQQESDIRRAQDDSALNLQDGDVQRARDNSALNLQDGALQRARDNSALQQQDINIQHYQENTISSARPEELTLMMYNGLLKFVARAQEEIKSKSLEAAHNTLLRCQDIVFEFQYTLNMDYSVSNNLMLIYDYLYNRLIEANAKKDCGILDEVYGFVAELRDTWVEAVRLSKEREQAHGEAADAVLAEAPKTPNTKSIYKRSALPAQPQAAPASVSTAQQHTTVPAVSLAQPHAAQAAPASVSTAQQHTNVPVMSLAQPHVAQATPAAPATPSVQPPAAAAAAAQYAKVSKAKKAPQEIISIASK